MENKEKIFIRVRFGLTIQKIIESNKEKQKVLKEKGRDAISLITSLRKLAASSGVEFSIIQKISVGKRNPEFTTVKSIADGFGLTLSELMKFFDNITDEQVMAALASGKQTRTKM